MIRHIHSKNTKDGEHLAVVVEPDGSSSITVRRRDERSDHFIQLSPWMTRDLHDALNYAQRGEGNGQ